MSKRRNAVFFCVITILIIAFFWINIVLGSADISVREVLGIITGGSSETMESSIIMGIRMPRAISAVLLGGALALSGYLLQTFFGNPIVGPFVLGISSGAKLFVALTMIFFLSLGKQMGLNMMVLAAFVGASLAMAFVLLISVKVRNMSILVVCGIMTGYIC